MTLLSIASWNPAHGGPFFSVGSLAAALAQGGEEVSLLAGDYPHLPAQSPIPGVPLHLVPGRRIPVIRQTWLPGLSTALRELSAGKTPSVIHDNGLWTSFNHGVAKVSEHLNCPRMVSPRGTLDPWSMRFRGGKKAVAWRLYQRRDLASAAVLHAASKRELEQIRTLGFSQPVALIPNGVELPERAARFSGDEPRRAVFIGRIHPIKNLDGLLRAWAEVKPQGWKLEIVGSNENRHREALEALAAELGIRSEVDFRAACYGPEKAKILERAELLFMVSHSENFGIAAAEGLAAGLPVIASDQTPWQGLVERKAGWWVPGSVEALAAAIADASRRDSQELQAMGAKGRQWMEADFAWPAIARRFQSVYHWMAGKAPRPADLH